jgi:hypothetical protein
MAPSKLLFYNNLTECPVRELTASLSARPRKIPPIGTNLPLNLAILTELRVKIFVFNAIQPLLPSIGQSVSATE